MRNLLGLVNFIEEFLNCHCLSQTVFKYGVFIRMLFTNCFTLYIEIIELKKSVSLLNFVHEGLYNNYDGIMGH